jgi:hypothetical protein
MLINKSRAVKELPEGVIDLLKGSQTATAGTYDYHTVMSVFIK